MSAPRPAHHGGTEACPAWAHRSRRTRNTDRTADIKSRACKSVWEAQKGDRESERERKHRSRQPEKKGKERDFSVRRLAPGGSGGLFSPARVPSATCRVKTLAFLCEILIKEALPWIPSRIDIGGKCRIDWDEAL